LALFSNPWVIGIGGGILSGLIVTTVSRALFSRRDKREYTQKLLGANHEVLYAIRPGISEGLVPSKPVLEALVTATARQYGVDATDLYSPTEIAQELMKEVMDSSFISAKAKQEYCSQLSPLTTPVPSPTDSKLVGAEARRPQGVEEYRRRMVTLMSVMLGSLTAMMTLAYALSKDGLSSSISRSDGLFGGTFVPLFLALLSMLVATLALNVLRRRLDRKEIERLRRRLDRREREPGSTTDSDSGPRDDAP